MNTDPIVAALKEEAQLWLAADDHDFNRGIARAWLRLAENLEARLTPPPAPAPAAQAALDRERQAESRLKATTAKIESEVNAVINTDNFGRPKPAPESDWRGECEIRRSIMHDGYYASVFCGGKTWYLCEGNVWRHDPANDASENTQMFPSESAARAALDKADPPPGVEPASKADGVYRVMDRIWIDGPHCGTGIYGGPGDEATTWCMNLNNAYGQGYSAGLAAAKPRRFRYEVKDASGVIAGFNDERSAYNLVGMRGSGMVVDTQLSAPEVTP